MQTKSHGIISNVFVSEWEEIPAAKFKSDGKPEARRAEADTHVCPCSAHLFFSLCLPLSLLSYIYLCIHLSLGPQALLLLYCLQPELTGDYHSRSCCTTTCKAFTISSISRLGSCKSHDHKTHCDLNAQLTAQWTFWKKAFMTECQLSGLQKMCLWPCYDPKVSPAFLQRHVDEVT